MLRSPPASLHPLPPFSLQVSSPRYAYFRRRITPRRDLSLIAAGREVCNRDYRIERRGFPCLTMEYVLDGRGSLQLNRQSYPLHPGVLFCYGPSVAHVITNREDRPMSKYFVNFFGDEARVLLREGGLLPGTAVQSPDIETVGLLFDQMIAHGAQDLRHAESICASFLRIIILKASEGLKPSRPRESPLTAHFTRWKDHLDQHFARLHDLGEVARELRVRPAYLCRVFRRHGYPSPFQYLTRRKMNRAAQLLAGDGLPVKHVASAVGYADPYHFSRVFKNHFGQAPRHFLEHSARTPPARED
ncbi:MAG: helix-turn-helix domain-containing protein [Opitutaceae bacterium]|nr:helix-turn-helix domain-containing protein [Opitutaceae bacterium]